MSPSGGWLVQREASQKVRERIGTIPNLVGVAIFLTTIIEPSNT